MLLLPFVGAACRDMTGATGLGRVAPTSAALAFSSRLAAEPGEPVVPTELARVRLFRLPTEMPERAILDTIVSFGDADDSRTMTFALTLTMVSERFGIELSLLDDRSQVIYQARDTIVAYTAGAAPPKLRPIVLRYAGPDTAVSRIAIAPGETSLAIGDAVPLRVDAYLASGAKTSAWVGYAVHGSSGITVDRSGTLRAVAPVAKGSAWVVARLATGLADSVAVSAIVPAVKLTVSPVNGATTVGGRLRLASLAFDSSGVVLVGREPSWSTSDPTIATVVDGVVTGIGPGTVQITARSERAVATTLVTVSPKPVVRIVASDEAISIVAGGTASVSVLPLNQDGVAVPGRTALWAVRNADVATVASVTDPAQSAVVVRGVAAGSTTLDVTVDGIRASILVAVTPKPVGRVTIVPGEASLLVGETILAAAAVRDADGVLQPERAVAWRSLAPDLVTVDGNGSVTARSPGVAKVVASVDGVADTMSVTVRRISTMTISHSTRAPDPHGDPVITLVLRALDQAGAVIEGQGANWTIKGPAELLDRIGSSVRVRLHGLGASLLTASAGDAEATLVIESSDVLATQTN